MQVGQVSTAGASHVGQVRAVNEDAWFAGRRLAVIADGMGGHARGDVASALAIRTLSPLDRRAPLTVDEVLRALERANSVIVDEGASDQVGNAMGTTVTGVARVDYAGAEHWLVFNIGDSRVYRVCADHVEQLTTDHSEVAELVATGEISPEEARTHPHRNIVTRSLGIAPGPPADTWIFPTRSDDHFLLCSDGLVNELSDAEIFDVLRAEPQWADGAEVLVRRAVAAGGRDNVTVLLVRVAPAPVADDTDVSTTPRPVIEAS